MRLSDNKIEEIRAATDIQAVVQEYVTLKKKGGNWFGLCPFHNEATPSFSVNPARQIFHCFGCGKGGNVFSFVMELERISFVEAVKMFAEKAGIELPKFQEKGDHEGPSEAELLLQANGMAKDYFYAQLTNQTSAQAKEAKNYLASRGYGDEVISRFSIGYAPDGWDGLTEHAKKNNVPLGVMMKAGLLKEGQQMGKPYDAFRHRVMFPIRNLSGKVIGFGGRRLREEAEGPDSAKYINSPETAIYHKGRELFGLWEARNEIRRDEQRGAILVEGYTDVVSMAMAGVNSAVASLGTSLTTEQARLLKRFTNNVTILYDGDSAGFTAARRAIDILLSVGIYAKVAVLPEGEDPDTFAKKNGKEGIFKKLNEAKSPVEFQLFLSQRAGAPLRHAVRELLASAATITDAVEQEIFLREVSAKANVSLDALLKELPKVPTQQQRVEQNMFNPAAKKWPNNPTVTMLSRNLVRWPEVRGVIFEQWTPAEIEDEYFKNLLNHLYQEWQAGVQKESETLLDQFTESPLREFIAESLSRDDADTADDKRLEIHQKEALDCLRNLEAEKIREAILEIKQKMAEAPESLTLVTELQTLMKKEKQLKAENRTVLKK